MLGRAGSYFYKLFNFTGVNIEVTKAVINIENYSGANSTIISLWPQSQVIITRHKYCYLAPTHLDFLQVPVHLLPCPPCL